MELKEIKNQKISIEERISKTNTKYYVWCVNGQQVCFLTIPQEVYKIINFISNQEKRG